MGQKNRKKSRKNNKSKVKTIAEKTVAKEERKRQSEPEKQKKKKHPVLCVAVVIIAILLVAYIATSIKNPRIPVFRNAGKENMMILWNLFWGNCVCQHSSVKVIVLRRQANHNAVPTNTNRKTNQTSVFRGPANSLLTEYPIQHRIRHHIGKQLRL